MSVPRYPANTHVPLLIEGYEIELKADEKQLAAN